MTNRHAYAKRSRKGMQRRLRKAVCEDSLVSPGEHAANVGLIVRRSTRAYRELLH